MKDILFYCLITEYNNIVVIVLLSAIDGLGLGLWCLTPLSTIFQLYLGSQFYRCREPRYPVKTTDLSQVTDKLLYPYICIEYTSSLAGFELTT